MTSQGDAGPHAPCRCTSRVSFALRCSLPRSLPRSLQRKFDRCQQVRGGGVTASGRGQRVLAGPPGPRVELVEVQAVEQEPHLVVRLRSRPAPHPHVSTHTSPSTGRPSSKALTRTWAGSWLVKVCTARLCRRSRFTTRCTSGPSSAMGTPSATSSSPAAHSHRNEKKDSSDPLRRLAAEALWQRLQRTTLEAHAPATVPHCPAAVRAWTRRRRAACLRSAPCTCTRGRCTASKSMGHVRRPRVCSGPRKARHSAGGVGRGGEKALTTSARLRTTPCRLSMCVVIWSSVALSAWLPSSSRACHKAAGCAHKRGALCACRVRGLAPWLACNVALERRTLPNSVQAWR